MLVRSPAEFFIKYLVTHPAGYANKTIQRKLKRLRLVDIGEEYIDALREDCQPPDIFKPKIKSHRASQQFLRDEGIFKLWHPDEHTKMAIAIRDDAQAQELAETFVLLGGGDENICAIIDRRLGLDVSREAVRRFRHYFWNTRLCNRAELREICYGQALHDAHDKSLTVAQREAAKKAYYKDPRALAATLPTSPVSTAVVETLLGFTPSKMDTYKGASLARDNAIRKIHEAQNNHNRSSAGEARDWAIVVREMREEVESQAAPEDDLREQMKNTRLVTNAVEIPKIEAITGGDYSDGSFVEEETGEEEDVLVGEFDEDDE